MAWLIDAEQAEKVLSEYYHLKTETQHLALQEALNKVPTVDAVPLDGSFLKMSKGDYVIYQREWLYEHLEQELDILRSVSGKPTIDAEPVRHGKWIDGHCSLCGCDVPAYIEDWKWIKDMNANYCPNCGARMDRE